MLRTLLTSKIALALVAIVPWVAGEIALWSGCSGSCARSASAVAVEAGTNQAPHSMDCVIYETASGRLLTVKAPSGHVPAGDCVRI
jgi:hypothetical protein